MLSCIRGLLAMRKRGLEPPRISPPEPRPGAATDYATCAVGTPGSAPGLTNYKLAALLIKLCPLVATVYQANLPVK